MKLYIQHPSIINNPVTFLNADYLAGATTLKLKNTQGFSTSKFAVIGNYGFDQAELIRPITIPDVNTFTNAAIKFPHNADSKVTFLDFDQIRIYRSTTGVNGSYALLATINIQVDQEVTMYEDVGALTSYYYKFAFFNSVSTVEDEQSDPYSAGGFVFYSKATLINRALSLYGDSKAEFVSRDEVADFLQEFYDDAQRELVLATKRHNVSSFVVTLAQDDSEYDLPGDFINEIAVQFSTDGGLTWNGRGVNRQLDSLSPSYGDSFQHTYTIRGGKIYVDDPLPQNSTDQMRILYTPSFVSLSLPTDTLAVPFSTSSGMFVKYALGMIYLKGKNFDEGKYLIDHARDRLKEFITYIKKLNNVHPEFSAGGATYR